MPRTIPTGTENDVLELALCGLDREEIAAKTGISTGSVSNILERLSEKLGKGDFQATRNLMLKFRRIGITPMQAASGARTFSLLQKLCMNDDDLGPFLTEVYGECKKIGLQSSELVQYAAKMKELASSSDVPLQDLPARYEKLLNEKGMLEKEITALKQEAAQAREDREKEVKQKNLELETLKLYIAQRDELARLGVDIHDLPALANMLKQGSDLKFGVNKVLDQLRKKELLEQTVKKLELELERLAEEEKRQKDLIKNKSRTIASQRSFILQLNRLKNLGMTAEYLQDLHQVIIDMALAKNLDPRKIVAQFKSEIMNEFSKKLSLQESLQRVKDEIITYSKERDKIRMDTEDLKVTYRGNLNAIHKVQQLEKRGVDAEMIVRWSWVLANSNLNLESLERDLEKYGSLNNSTAALGKEVERLKTEGRKLQSVVKTLADQKDGLEASIKETGEFTRKSTLDMAEEAVRSLSAVKSSSLDSINKVSSDATNSINEVKRSATDKLDDIMSALGTMVAKISEASEELSRLKALKPIYAIINGSKGERHEVYPALLAFLERLDVWLQKYGDAHLCDPVRRVADRIREWMMNSEHRM